MTTTQSTPHPHAHPHAAEPDPVDLAERGRGDQRMDTRLYMQLLVFGGCTDTAPLTEVLAKSVLDAVLYEQWDDPTGVGLLTMHEHPEFFVDHLRPLLKREPFASLTPKPDMTMVGRTYALGYEPSLQEVLFDRPKRHAMNADWPWAVWYPLRRGGAFEQLDPQQQRDILVEHSRIGIAYGKADHAHDIRLVCTGLDEHDNDFVIGLVGKRLVGLSSIVAAMRKTTQTSMYLNRLGPFFVGRATWRSQQATPTLV